MTDDRKQPDAASDTPDGVIRDAPREYQDNPVDPNYAKPATYEDDDLRIGGDAATRERLDDDRNAERGISPVGGSEKSKRFMQFSLVGGMLVVGAVLLAMTWPRAETDSDAEDAAPPTQPAVLFSDVQGAPPPPPTLEGENAVLDPLSIQETGPGGGGSGERIAPPIDPRIARLEASRRAPIMALTSNPITAGASGSPAEGGTGLVSQLLGQQGEPAEPNALDTLNGTTDIARVRASMLPNRNYLVTAGTQIPCSLQTAMDSSVPGFVSCVINSDVYSDNGNVVLLEKGTRVLGEYRGQLQQGQNRLFVVWNRAVTPRGVSVSLGSPAADALGRAGVGGDVENFFWQRFGGALMLSIVDDGVALAAADYREARQTLNSPSQAAATALENSINIPPRLRKNQGTAVTIFAANDFDFSGVYRLRTRR